MLQTYQDTCLAEPEAQLSSDGPLDFLLNESGDYILHMSHCAALSLGRGKAFTGVTETPVTPDRDRATYLDEQVSADDVWADTHNPLTLQAKFKLRKRQTGSAQHNTQV